MTPKTIEALAEEYSEGRGADGKFILDKDGAKTDFLAGHHATLKMLAEGAEGWFPPRVTLAVDPTEQGMIFAHPETPLADQYEYMPVAEHLSTVARHLAEVASLREVLQRCLQFASCRNYSRAEVEECIRSEIAAFRASETEQKEGGNAL